MTEALCENSENQMEQMVFRSARLKRARGERQYKASNWAEDGGKRANTSKKTKTNLSLRKQVHTEPIMEEEDK